MANVIVLAVFAVLFVICIVFSVTCYGRLLRAYNKYKTEFVYCGLTGYQFAVYMIETLGLDTKIAKTKKELGEYYYPQKDVIVLSDQTFEKSNVASISITAHELGHAVQHKNKSFLFELSNVLTVFCKIANILFLPLVVAGIVMLFFENLHNASIVLLLCAFSFWLLTYLLKILLIPLEFNASKIAYNFLKDHNVLSDDELKHAKKMLRYAGNTYIASLFSGVIKFFNLFRR